MILVAKVFQYNKEKKMCDVKLLIDASPEILIKNIVDARSTFGGGVTVEQPLATGDIVLLLPISAPKNIKKGKISLRETQSSNQYVVTAVIETKKNTEASFIYEDSNNKIILDGTGKASIKIGQFTMFEFFTDVLDVNKKLIKAIKNITFNTVTQGGLAFGSTDLAPLIAALAPIETNVEKLEQIIKGVEKK